MASLGLLDLPRQRAQLLRPCLRLKSDPTLRFPRQGAVKGEIYAVEKLIFPPSMPKSQLLQTQLCLVLLMIPERHHITLFL